ncbi:hypothetical protein [Salinibacter ruber]|uniref:Uncharacterized protein n=1 Tax=Salinibacter ruber TaxID=146919 RepID=A0AAW5P6Z2_9BACT|nr:hypothetical protein [Salinibacter ruber]MCS4157670.1 hypothetical protein [Salinibacter ruber]
MSVQQVDALDASNEAIVIHDSDDPAEGGGATLQDIVDQAVAIEQAIGDETTASEQPDSLVAATVLERLTALVDALQEGQADDQIRVDLTNNNANLATTGDLGTLTSVLRDKNTSSQEADSSVAATTIERLSALVDALASGQASDEIRVELIEDSLTTQLEVNDSAVGSEGAASEEADSSVAATVIERLSALVDALQEGQADDQIRVDLTNNNSDVATTGDIAALEATIGDDTTASENPDSATAATVIERLSALTDALTTGQADDQLRVDLTNNNSDVATSSDVQSLESAVGDETTAAQEPDSTIAATLIERVTALTDALTSGQADDAVRVSLAQDILSGNLDVNIGGQDSQVAVQLASDSLTANLDVDLAEASAEPLDVSGATVPTEQQTPVQLESSTGTNIDPATEQTVSAIKTAAEALDDALASNGTDTLQVSTPSPIDASAAEIDVDLNSQSLSNLSVDLAQDSLTGNLDVDLAEASAEPIDVSGATVPTEQQSPIKLEDSGGAAINPATEAAVSAVEAAIGDETTPAQQADSSLAATLIQRVTALVDALQSGQADDEIRVALASDLLSGNLDVNLNGQSGSVNVNLSSDSLAGALDVDIAANSNGTLQVEQQSPVKLEDGAGNTIDPLSAGDQPLDVSQAELDINLNSQSLSRVATVLQATDGTSYGEVGRTGDAVRAHLAGQDGEISVSLTNDSLGANLDVDLSEVSAGTLAVEQQTPVQVEDSSGTNIDPATSGDVSAVEAAIGDESTASEQADSGVSATLIERVTALVDALTSGQADDELRVALASDLLSGNIDVDIAGQSGPNLTVELAADSLTSGLDVDIAEQTSGALDVSGATVPTEQQSPVQLETSGGANIDPATEQTVTAIKAAAEALDDALASNGTDEVRVTSPNPLDASAAEIDVDLNSQSLQNVSVELSQDSLSDNLDVDLAAASAEPLDVSGATVPTEQQSPVGIEDPQGTQIQPATDPGIRGGATQQDIVDAIYESALAQQSVNEKGILITDATSARTTDTQTSGAYKGVMVFVNVNNIGGTSPELTARIQRKTPGGVVQNVISTGALTASGLSTLQVHPSLSDSSNKRAGELLGREWRVDVGIKTSAGDESYQYDIEYTYVN